ncbi:MAG: tandem-95 repeat protein, partial [Planctomycetes bacterium]|nr:tandem-95 repeat protein [Planctomycetota bacterium]
DIDFLITLGSYTTDVEDNIQKYTVKTLPDSGTAGTLYQYNAGSAGAAINAINTDVTDASGRIFFRPASGVNGSALDTFTYTATDNTTESNASTITLDVTAVNDAPANSVPGAQTTDEDADLVFSSGNSNLISISDDAGTDPVEITLTGGNGTATLSQITGLTFTAGDGSDDSTMTFTGTITNVNSAFSGLTFSPTADYNGSASLQIATDDQGYTGGGALSDTDIITITVDSVNDVPAYTKGSDQTVNEDAGAQTALGWATSLSEGATNEASQTLSFNVSNDNNALFTVQPAIDASGNLTYTPAANANGSTTVTVSISDDGGTTNSGDDTSADQTFTITVTAVNDEPSFTAGADQTVDEDSGAQTENGWATSLSKGPSDESGQTLSFNVSNNNNSLFSTQPDIDSSGNLTYTSAANAAGTATVTVSISDDGGTANSGDDTSDDQTFTITVTNLQDLPTSTNSTATATEDTTYTFTAADFNFTDVDTADTLSQAKITSLETVGDLKLSGSDVTLNQEISKANIDAGNLTFVPVANANGASYDSFEFMVHDGTAYSTSAYTMTVDLTAVNDAPVLDDGQSPVLTAIDEDDSTSAGDTVGSIVVDASITEAADG